MCKLALHSVVLLSFFLATCNADEDFLQCISTNSKDSIDTFVHKPNSPSYSSILKSAQKNSRWLNSTSAHPLFLVAPCDEVQIQGALQCSKKLGIQVRVKSGGHDYEGLSFRCETPFIIIDIGNLQSIKIDLNEETAWIQTGVTIGQLYYAIAKESKTHAFPAGLCPTLGSGGHISGGGIGTMMRKYGLAADNVLDARVIDANGKILDRATMGDDLFWAIRGGGGASFGIIFAWKLKLVRVPKLVTSFTVQKQLDAKGIQLIQRWQSIAHEYPEDLFVRIILHNSPSVVRKGKNIAQVSFQGLFLGKAKKLVPLISQSFPEFELETKDCFQDPIENKSCTENPCVKKECYQISWIQSMLYFAGKKPKEPLEYLASRDNSRTSYFKAKSDFLTKPIPDNGWEMIGETFLKEDSPVMIIDPFGGRMNQISENALPFPHRNGTLYNIQYLVYWNNNEPIEANKHIDWIRQLDLKMEPFVSHSPRAAYYNYRDLDLGVNEQGYGYERAKTWGERYFKHNFARLAGIKKVHDPSNIFRNEQSIPLLQQEECSNNKEAGLSL